MSGPTLCLPKPEILRGYRNRTWTVASAVSEFADNAFGQDRGNADILALAWNKKTGTLDVLDNGRGMPAVSYLFVLGLGAGDTASDIGRYGLGGSQALLWLADSVDIWTLDETGVGHTYQNIRRNIPDLGKCAWFEVDDSRSAARKTSVPAELEAFGHGTMIRLALRRERRIAPALILEEMEKVYAPALRHGRRIVWRENGDRRVLRPWDPRLEGYSVTEEISVRGLGVHITAGVAPEVTVREAAMSVSWGHREIFRTRDPFGSYAGGRVWGRIDLRPEWKPFLSTNKDGLTDDGLEFDLMAAANRVILTVLDHLRAEDKERLEASLRLEVEVSLSDFLRRVNRNTKSGPSGPANVEKMPGEKRPSPEIQTESGEDRERPDGISIKLTGDTDQQLQGCFMVAELKIGAGLEVRYNEENEVVQAAMEEPVPRYLWRALITEAFAVELLERDLVVQAGLFKQDDWDRIIRSVRTQHGLISHITPRILERIRQPARKRKRGTA